jgi:hypothetical protein
VTPVQHLQGTVAEGSLFITQSELGPVTDNKKGDQAWQTTTATTELTNGHHATEVEQNPDSAPY